MKPSVHKTNDGQMQNALPADPRKRRWQQRVAIQPGQRVLITNPHPWAGHTGTVREKIKTLVGEMWSVELDNGMNAGCQDYDLKAV